MFRFDHRKEEEKRKDRELMNQVHLKEKPKFKDLVAIMLAQYIIVLPVVFIGMLVFGLVLRGVLAFWGS